MEVKKDKEEHQDRMRFENTAIVGRDMMGAEENLDDIVI